MLCMPLCLQLSFCDAPLSRPAYTLVTLPVKLLCHLTQRMSCDVSTHRQVKQMGADPETQAKHRAEAAARLEERQRRQQEFAEKQAASKAFVTDVRHAAVLAMYLWGSKPNRPWTGAWGLGLGPASAYR